MISGNCNRSPQYNAMGPPNPHMYAANNQRAFVQQPQPHNLLFMTGGSVRAFPQMSRGFSMMPNGGSPAAVVHCSIQQGFGNSGFGNSNYGYHANPAHIFQQHYNYQQPQSVHPQQQYVQHQYTSPPPPIEARREQTSGFINGIKNMVKGIIQPLNCDFYSDHHKYYNPKYRNNYMMDLKTENMSYTPQKAEPHVQTVKAGLEIGKSSVKPCDTKPPPNASQPNEQVVVKESPPKPIFSSEDFPELPAPRRSRSVTPAKTETTQKPKCNMAKKNSIDAAKESTVQPTPKSTFFEIMCTITPSGRRPTFGGRLKVVPPPFSLNKTKPSCRNFCPKESSTNDQKDCDIEEDSFVIFQHEPPAGGNCLFSSFKRPQRQRQISECSDDSFVVFFTEDADCLGQMNCDEDDDTDDDEDDDDDGLDTDEETSSEEEEEEDSSDDENDEDDNGVDVVDSSFLGRNKTDRNKCDDERTLLCSALAGVVAEHKQLDSGFDEKKVTFDPHPVVHVMHTWNYAYRAARKGHWEDFARDRTRFQKRIERTSVYLNPVLTPDHREKIYHSRFCDVDKEEQQQPQQQQRATNTKLNTGSHHQATVSHGDNNHKLPKLTKLPDCASF